MHADCVLNPWRRIRSIGPRRRPREDWPPTMSAKERRKRPSVLSGLTATRSSKSRSGKLHPGYGSSQPVHDEFKNRGMHEDAARLQSAIVEKGKNVAADLNSTVTDRNTDQQIEQVTKNLAQGSTRDALLRIARELIRNKQIKGTSPGNVENSTAHGAHWCYAHCRGPLCRASR